MNESRFSDDASAPRQYCVPANHEPPLDNDRGVWSPDQLVSLVETLDSKGGEALADLQAERITSAWSKMLAELADPDSRLRRALSPILASSYVLSEAGLQAAFENVTRGAGDVHAKALVERAATLESLDRPLEAAIVVLPANIPGLSVQVILPALLAGRPLLLKSPHREPWLTAAIVAALHGFEPALETAVAAVAWVGGDRSIEDRVFPGRQIIAYGSGGTCRELAARRLDRPVLHGASLSLEVISSEIDPSTAAIGIVRDVALFDQRGCLCPDAIYVENDPQPLAHALIAELERCARHWPPGGTLAGQAVAVQSMRAEGLMLGLGVLELDLLAGTVIIDPDPTLRPSPGLRSLRIHQVPDFRGLPKLLDPHTGRLQACGLAGTAAFEIEAELQNLGFSRIAPTGQLQDVIVGWRNGGLDPLEVFARRKVMSR